ncbi:CorA family divalent cation transporter [Frigoribacterium faeni]|uniref:CorA family divalent cation transporter n=1 Tax=Frigoribacterium faeni TaxID=145483 RepID=UPI001ABB4949|nr:CorA family divalent cation transporter [Frigoribacterium faeni]NIJ04508.1 Mg2+ and Co2+ transporter CorA [Frigoribacterium faeni]
MTTAPPAHVAPRLPLVRVLDTGRLDVVDHDAPLAPGLGAEGRRAAMRAHLGVVLAAYDDVLEAVATRVDEVEDGLLDERTESFRPLHAALRDVAVVQRCLRRVGHYVAEHDALADASSLRPTAVPTRSGEAVRWADLTDRAASLRAALRDALTIHAAVETERQNDELRRLSEASLALGRETRDVSRTGVRRAEESKTISSWAAILFAPTLIGTVYGMNFEHMPELGWVGGYPLAVGAMLAMGVGLWLAFRRKGWL